MTEILYLLSTCLKTNLHDLDITKRQVLYHNYGNFMLLDHPRQELQLVKKFN